MHSKQPKISRDKYRIYLIATLCGDGSMRGISPAGLLSPSCKYVKLDSQESIIISEVCSRGGVVHIHCLECLESEYLDVIENITENVLKEGTAFVVSNAYNTVVHVRAKPESRQERMSDLSRMGSLSSVMLLKLMTDYF